MKFLVTVTPKPITPIPPNVAAQLLGAQREWLHERMKDGAVEAAYGFVGGGGVGIVNADSHEDLHDLIVNSPGFPISDFEIKPLGNLDTTISSAIASLENAANMMAGAAG